jgi:hypothetical protein
MTDEDILKQIPDDCEELLRCEQCNGRFSQWLKGRYMMCAACGGKTEIRLKHMVYQLAFVAGWRASASRPFHRAAAQDAQSSYVTMLDTKDWDALQKRVKALEHHMQNASSDAALQQQVKERGERLEELGNHWVTLKEQVEGQKHAIAQLVTDELTKHKKGMLDHVEFAARDRKRLRNDLERREAEVVRIETRLNRLCDHIDKIDPPRVRYPGNDGPLARIDLGGDPETDILEVVNADHTHRIVKLRIPLSWDMTVDKRESFK